MLVLLAQLLIQDPRAAFTKESFKIILPHKQSRTPTPGTHTHTHTCKSIIRKRVSPKTRHRVPKVRTQQPTTTHQHKCRIMNQSFWQLPSTRNVHFAERNPVCDMPSRETIVRSVRIPTTMPERYQAVNSTAARTPGRGSAGREGSPRHNRTHAPTGPRKART